MSRFTLFWLIQKLSKITRFRRKVKGLKTVCAGRFDFLWRPAWDLLVLPVMIEDTVKEQWSPYKRYRKLIYVQCYLPRHATSGNAFVDMANRNTPLCTPTALTLMMSGP